MAVGLVVIVGTGRPVEVGGSGRLVDTTGGTGVISMKRIRIVCEDYKNCISSN